MNQDKIRQAIALLQAALADIDSAPASVQHDDEDDDPVPGGAPAGTWQKVAGAYARRYRKTRGLEWYAGAHTQALMDITEQLCQQKGNVHANMDKLLDAFFADDFARKTDYAPGLLAKKFGAYMKPIDEDNRLRDLERQKRGQEALRRHQEAQRQAEEAHARKVAERGAEAAQSPMEVRTLVRDWLKE